MQAVEVSGRFSVDDRPIEGTIRFTPSMVFIVEHGVPYAPLAPEVTLDKNGRFKVMVTRTDQAAGANWHYKVECPAGIYTVRFEGEGPFSLKDQVNRKFV